MNIWIQSNFRCNLLDVVRQDFYVADVFVNKRSALRRSEQLMTKKKKKMNIDETWVSKGTDQEAACGRLRS